MKWLDNLKARFRWRWVGTVEGECYSKKENGDRLYSNVYWNLYERGDGVRRFDVSGKPEWNDSSHVRHRRALVRAWKAGGPLPPVMPSSAPPAKNKPVLLAFPGGRDGAA